MKNKLFAFGAIALTAPTLAFAQAATPGADLSSLLVWVNKLISIMVPLIIALAVVFFMWGVFKFVASGDDEEARKSGRQMMINGVIAIFVMVSLWGLVGFLDKTFGLCDTKQVETEVHTTITL